MNINIKHFKKRYKSQIVSIKDVRLNKRIVILKGINGSGKSTLLKAIANLITYEGVVETNHKISYIPDSIQFPKGVTLETFVNLFNRLDKYNKEVFEKLIDMFDLNEHFNKDVSELSKGMRCKVNVLLGLCLERDLYIMDEPFDGMDKSSKEKLIKYMNESDKSFLISTHLKEEVTLKDIQEVVLS